MSRYRCSTGRGAHRYRQSRSGVRRCSCSRVAESRWRPWRIRYPKGQAYPETRGSGQGEGSIMGR